MLIKKELVPGVIVYRSEIKNLNNIIECIKNSITESVLTSTWRQNGSIENHIYQADISDSNILKAKLENLQHQERYIFEQVQDLYYKIFQDYLIESKKENLLMPYIDKDKKIKENNYWYGVGLSAIIHKQTVADDEKAWESLNNKRETNSDHLRLGWHVDAVESGIEPGQKHAITANFYLNDNYEGGRINFLYGNTIENIYDKSNLKIICYKPLAGDIVVYPSMWPMAHSVSYSRGEDRYFFSSILRYYYDGSLGNDLERHVMPYETSLNEYSYYVDKNDIRYINGKDFWI